MELIQNKNNQIKAIVRLYEFCSLKKFLLVDEISLTDDIGKLAMTINNEISESEGINIFTAKDENDLVKYESYLNSYNLNFTKKYFPQSTLGDAFEFLKRIYQFPIDQLKNYNIDIDTGIKPILKSLKITIPQFNRYLHSPDHANMLQFSDKKNFFLVTSKKIMHTYKERIIILVFHQILDKEPLPNTNRKFLTGRLLINTLRVDGVYLIKNEFYSELFDKPARLLLKIIEKYGIELNFSGKTKKLFVEEIVDFKFHKTYEAIYAHINLQLRNKVKSHYTSGMMWGSGGIIADSITGYFVDDTKFINDFEVGEI